VGDPCTEGERVDDNRNNRTQYTLGTSCRGSGVCLCLHADQRRKGTNIPYIAHLMSVAALVLEHGGDEQGSSTLSTNAPLEQFVESGESGGISVLAER